MPAAACRITMRWPESKHLRTKGENPRAPVVAHAAPRVNVLTRSALFLAARTLICASRKRFHAEGRVSYDECMTAFLGLANPAAAMKKLKARPQICRVFPGMSRAFNPHCLFAYKRGSSLVPRFGLGWDERGPLVLNRRVSIGALNYFRRPWLKAILQRRAATNACESSPRP